MIRWLLARLGRCPHRHAYREIRSGVLMLVCDTCGHAVPAVTWTKAEKAKRVRLQRRLQKTSTVVEMLKRRRA